MAEQATWARGTAAALLAPLGQRWAQLLADALACCDLAAAPDGSPTTPEARLAGVIARYGDAHLVGRVVERSGEELLERVRPLRGVGAGGATAG